MYTVINPIPQEDINFINNIVDSGLAPYELEVIGTGYSAIVYRYKDYAIKVFEEDDCFFDGEILQNFQDNEIFLKLYFYSNSLMVTEYLDIQNAYEYYEKNVDIKYSALDIFEYCYNKGYIISDIHDENVIVTKDDKLKIIDVGSFNKLYDNNNYSLENVLAKNSADYSELDCIINHVKIPPIAI
jgi:serine/threonine protein kinase